MKSQGAVAVFFLLALAVAGLLLLLVWFAMPGQPAPPPFLAPPSAGEVIAAVGRREITRLHLSLFRQSERIKGGKDAPEPIDYGLLRELLEAATFEDILERHGFKLGPDLIAAERDRVNRETREPEKLKRIQELMAPHRGMYDAIIIKPILANQNIHKMHNFDEALQAAAWKEARELHARVLADPHALAREGKARKEPMEYQVIDSRVRPEHSPPGSEPMHREQAQRFAKEHFDKVKPGDVRPTIIDERGALMIARLLERDGDDVKYEILVIRKEPFEPWFREQLKKITITIHDPELRRLLLEKAKGNPLIDRVADILNQK